MQKAYDNGLIGVMPEKSQQPFLLKSEQKIFFILINPFMMFYYCLSDQKRI